MTRLKASFWKYTFLALSIYIFFISPANSVTEWEKVQERGFLTWVTRPSPMTYYSGLDGIMGLEYQILKEFCDAHDLELLVNVAESTRRNNPVCLFRSWHHGLRITVLDQEDV